MEQTIKYLNFLDNKTKNFLFACYDYRKIKKGRQIYGTFEECQKKLSSNNNEAFCVYVTVNETDGPNRKKENIVRCRAIWVEDDSKRDTPREDFPLPPSLVVESSPNKYHYYWFTSTKNFDEWNAVMQTMVDSWGCDKWARDICRVLRLPGFKHKKDPKSDYVTKIVSGDGAFYTWLGIRSIFKPTKIKEETESTERPKEELKKGDSGYSEQKAIKELMSSENYHGSLTSISMSLTNRGVSRELQYHTLYGLMQKIPKKTRREEWAHRASSEHIYECIDTAIRKRQLEEKDKDITSLPDNYDPEWNIKGKETDFPPGLMGQFCKEIFETAPYPNKEIAIAAGFGLVAGICGRAFNVMGMGLNTYIAVLADSGIGKAVLKDVTNSILRGTGGPFNIGQTFAGKSRFTGPKAVFDMLQKGMSRICIIEEAGLVGESKAGDQSGLTRAFLDLFTSSGYGKWAGDEGYSSIDNSIPSLHSPALSIVSVSTPKSFLAALKSKSADVSGEVARLWMMRSIGEKPYLNTNRRDDFSTEVTKRLGLLIKEASAFQMPEAEEEPRNIKVDEKYYIDANKWVDRENQYYRDGDMLRRTLCSRAFAKIIKLTAICCVFNGTGSIRDEEYKWVEKQVLDELNSISQAFTYESTDNLPQVSKYVMNYIYKIVKGKFGDSKKNSPKQLAEIGGFTYYSLSQSVKGSSVVKALDDDPSKPNPKTGLDKVLFYMLNAGLIIRVTEKELTDMKIKAKIAFKITDDFARTLSDEQKTD